jgi:hypothetical protein
MDSQHPISRIIRAPFTLLKDVFDWARITAQGAPQPSQYRGAAKPTADLYYN